MWWRLPQKSYNEQPLSPTLLNLWSLCNNVNCGLIVDQCYMKHVKMVIQLLCGFWLSVLLNAYINAQYHQQNNPLVLA